MPGVKKNPQIMPGVKKTPQKTPHVNRKGGGGGLGDSTL